MTECLLTIEDEQIVINHADGRKETLLDVDKRLANRSHLSICQQMVFVNRRREIPTNPLMHVWNSLPDYALPESVSILACLKFFLMQPHHIHCVYVGTTGDILRHGVDHLLSVIEPRGSLTYIRETLLPDQAATVLFFDGRTNLSMDFSMALLALEPDGLCILLGGTEDDQVLLRQHCENVHYLLDPEDGVATVAVGVKKTGLYTGKRQATLEKRIALLRLLHLFLQGNPEQLPKAIKACRAYLDILFSLEGELLKPDEKYLATRVLECLIDWRLGQADERTRTDLSEILLQLE